MDAVIWSKSFDPDEPCEAERKEAIRHLRHKLVEIWCNYPLNNFESHRQRNLIVKKIQKIKEGLC